MMRLASHAGFGLALALATLALDGLGTGCSAGEARPDGRAEAGPASDEDTADAGEAPFAGLCGTRACQKSPLGTPGCCTRPGAGVPGDALEATGRGPGLCGTDVGTLIPALAGTCVQLDQPGTIDSECPAQQPLRGGTRMAGCCTDEGFCGGLETIIGFGCFYATGRKGRPCTPDTDADAGG